MSCKIACPAWLSNGECEKSEQQPASTGRAPAAGRKAPVCSEAERNAESARKVGVLG